MKIAKYDLRAAQVSFDGEMYLTCVEKCHNAVEKLLKGIITEHGKVPSKIHNLLKLTYAKGTANEWSDVDVAVISPSLNKRSVLGNVLDISNKIKFYDSDLQLTAFPSQNFYQESFDPQSFIGEIKRTSKKIYNKKTGLDFSQL